MVTTEMKHKVLAAIQHYRPNYTSDARMATALGISAAQLSTIKKGKIERVISDANWISIARKLNVQMGEQMEWLTAKTPVFAFIYSQLKWCQQNNQSGLLADKADIGKTYTARCYVRENKHAVYIDCSQVKTKQKLIRQIAREFGVNHTGRYADVYEDLVFFIRSIPTPLIILDEAGDLDYPAFLELKALWNATERGCGWYMMGADGLKRKIESNLERKKVGYAELFSRFGNKFQKISPDGKEAWSDFVKTQISAIAKANYTKADVRKICNSTGGSLRRIQIEIRKQKKQN